MRELSFEDLRWVAGGLPSSGSEGQQEWENGTLYTYISGSWVETIIVEPESDPTPDTPYTWADFLADQAAQDFIDQDGQIYQANVASVLGTAADTIKKWRELTSPGNRDVIWRDNHSTFDGTAPGMAAYQMYNADGSQQIGTCWYNFNTQQWWVDTNNNGTPDIVAKYNAAADGYYADLDFNGTYETKLEVN